MTHFDELELDFAYYLATKYKLKFTDTHIISNTVFHTDSTNYNGDWQALNSSLYKDDVNSLRDILDSIRISHGFQAASFASATKQSPTTPSVDWFSMAINIHANYCIEYALDSGLVKPYRQLTSERLQHTNARREAWLGRGTFQPGQSSLPNNKTWVDFAKKYPLLWSDTFCNTPAGHPDWLETAFLDSAFPNELSTTKISSYILERRMLPNPNTWNFPIVTYQHFVELQWCSWSDVLNLQNKFRNSRSCTTGRNFFEYAINDDVIQLAERHVLQSNIPTHQKATKAGAL